MKYSEVKAIYRAIQSPFYLYARSRRYGSAIYQKDPSSPTGVIAVAFGTNDVVNRVLRRLRNNSPLSPTEGLCKGLRPR